VPTQALGTVDTASVPSAEQVDKIRMVGGPDKCGDRSYEDG